MCRGVRCTLRCASSSSPILARVRFARRKRRSLLLIFMIWLELLLLALFQRDLLAGVAHAFALVGLGRANVANLGSGLTNLLPVRALDHDLGLARRLDRDAGG